MITQNLVIQGHVTNEPNYKRTKTGHLLCTFTMAFNQYDHDMEEYNISYITVEAWEKLAVQCSERLQPGHRVQIIGEIKANVIGNSTSIIIVADRIIQK